MVQTKGYKAFKGILKIQNGDMSIAIRADWIYDPHDKMWHSDFGMFFGEFCEVIRDDSTLIINKKERKRNVHLF
jgi:hypothetical protein